MATSLMHRFQVAASGHMNSLAELRMIIIIPVDERVHVGDRDLDRLAIQRITHSADVGFQAGEHCLRCFNLGFAANAHFRKVSMLNLNSRLTTGIAKLFRHENHS
jgi:hypothetical protein